MAYEKANPFSILAPIYSISVTTFNSYNSRRMREDIYLVVETAKQIILHPNGNPKIDKIHIMRERELIAKLFETENGIEINWHNRIVKAEYERRVNEEE